MKKIYLVLFCLIASVTGYSQSVWTVGIDGGLDFSTNKYYSPNNYVKFENGKLEYHAGLGIGVRISNIVRFRINCNYGEYSYGVRPKDSNVFSESENTLTHVDLMPRVDVKLWSYRKFDLLVSPGMNIEFVVDSKNKTTLPNGDESKRVYVSSDYNSKYTGAMLGAIMRYKIDRHFAITLSPDYTYFFEKLYSRNNGTMQRFRVGLGVEWNI